MVHKCKARKDIINKWLYQFKILVSLSFEGVVPYGVWGFPDLDYLSFKDIGIRPRADKSPLQH